MNRCLRPLTRSAGLLAASLITLTALALPSTDARASSRKTHAAKEASHHRSAAVGKRHYAKRDAHERKSARPGKSPANDEASVPQLPGDLAAVKDAIALARKGKTGDATDIQNKITDPAARKLVEWFILRHSETSANFNRYAAFISSNPDWPSTALLRKRAEALLWQERGDVARDASTVHGFTLDRPTSAKG